MELSDIKSLLEAQGEKFAEFKNDQAARLGDIEKRLNRPGAFNGDNAPRAKTVETLSGKKCTILRKGDRLATGDADQAFSFAKFVRANLEGSHAGPDAQKYMGTTASLVNDELANMVIDDVRNQLVFAQAGARTVAIPGPTTIPRIDGDPTCYQHTEGADDILESDATISGIAANPKTLVALVPVTLELAADSPNFDEIIRLSLAGSFAQKIEQLAVAKLVADTDIAESAAAQDPATWAATMAAISAAMAAGQPLPRAMVSAAADFMARASQLASTSGAWLGRPPALAEMLELPTANVTAGTGFFGDFERAMVIAARQDMRVELIRWQQPTKAIHLLVAHMRADAYVLQPGALFRQLKVV